MKKSILLFSLLIVLSILDPKVSFAEENLQSLIDQTEEGGILHLENKTYEGNVVIEKPMEIVGEKGTVIKGDRTGNVISVKGEGVTIRNVTVTDSSTNMNTGEEYAGIKVYTNGNTIENVTVKNSFHGIYLSKAHGNKLINNDVTGLAKGEIAFQGNGLHIYYSSDNYIKGNTVRQTRDGMYFEKAHNNEMYDNHISETRYGLHYMFSDNNYFEGNTFTFNTGGAAVMESSDNVITGNKFIFNYGHQSFGLMLLSSNNSVVENNIMTLNQRGIYVDKATNNMIRNNEIVRNQIGIEIWASSNEQTFTDNTIKENTIPVFALAGQGRNVWSKDGVGNRWGNEFPLLDLDQNKVGDEPIVYRSSLSDLIEDQELTYLFLNSPAIKLYEKIQAFFAEPKLMFEDPAPLVK